MADLTTHWLGLELPHPLIPGASPLADDLDGVRRLQDAGAPVITLRSLVATPFGIADETCWLDQGAVGSPSRSMLAGLQQAGPISVDADAYCRHIQSVNTAVGSNVPVVASLYARRVEDWLSHARHIAQAGAAALELNVYGLVIEHKCDGPAVQRAIEQLINEIKLHVAIPIALKLLPVYPDFEPFAMRLSKVGVDGLILFNGFQRGDFRVEQIDDPVLRAACSPFDRHSRFRWLSKLSGRIRSDLAMSGGVRSAGDAARAILCGADVVQLVSKLILDGPEQLTTMLADLDHWFDSEGHESLDQVRGTVSQQRFGDFDQFDAAYAREILRPAG